MANIFESTTLQEGERATSTTHRKIELQSPQDLTYLIANVSRAAHEKLDKHLPPDSAAGPNDAMRKRVEGLVDDYITDTFESAKDGITVNGIEAREVDLGIEGEELEPFDSKLAQRIQSLSSQIERETLYLANKRRKAPQETAKNFLESFEQQSQAAEAKLKADQEAKMEAARATKVDVGAIPRVDEMQSTFQRGKEDLAGLNAGLEGTVKRMERAQKAVEAVEK